MLVRMIAIVVLLPWAQPAFALDTCFIDSVGAWHGPVVNRGRVQALDTEFHLAADGTLAASYTVHDTQPFDGTLSGFHQTAACEADFTWTDPYGSGTLHIRFAPDQGRFEGYWGMAHPQPGSLFNGYRAGGTS